MRVVRNGMSDRPRSSAEAPGCRLLGQAGDPQRGARAVAEIDADKHSRVRLDVARDPQRPGVHRAQPNVPNQPPDDLLRILIVAADDGVGVNHLIDVGEPRERDLVERARDPRAGCSRCTRSRTARITASKPGMISPFKPHSTFAPGAMSLTRRHARAALFTDRDPRRNTSCPARPRRAPSPIPAGPAPPTNAILRRPTAASAAASAGAGAPTSLAP